MRYRTLGRTGIKVSPYALGAMMFGAAIGNPDHDDSIRIIHKAVDAGINFVDTADAYSPAASPRRSWARRSRDVADHVVLATKVHLPMGDDPIQRGNSRRWIMTEVENSLRRLQGTAPGPVDDPRLPDRSPSVQRVPDRRALRLVGGVREGVRAGCASGGDLP